VWVRTSGYFGTLLNLPDRHRRNADLIWRKRRDPSGYSAMGLLPAEL
jgi:hypothetical protein